MYTAVFGRIEGKPLCEFAAPPISCTEPVFVNVYSPGNDSEGSIPAAYVALRDGTTKRFVVPARQAGNRFLGSYKGLQIRALQQLRHLLRVYY
jgi:hypothetical protein